MPGGADSDSCLTPAQVEVVREFYRGPTDPQGRLLYPGGAPYGSEGGWSVFELPPSPNGGSVPTTESLDYFGLSQPYLRYQLLAPGRLGPDPSQWQFTDAGFRSMFPAADTWDAMSTDLRAFRAHGGKLIMWQGWADNGIPPSGTVDYYDTLAGAKRRSSDDRAVRAPVHGADRLPLRRQLRERGPARPDPADGGVGRDRGRAEASSDRLQGRHSSFCAAACIRTR